MVQAYLNLGPLKQLQLCVVITVAHLYNRSVNIMPNKAHKLSLLAIRKMKVAGVKARSCLNGKITHTKKNSSFYKIILAAVVEPSRFFWEFCSTRFAI